MREANALETIVAAQAKRRRLAALARVEVSERVDRRNPDERDDREQKGRTDTAVSRKLGIGGKDVYRQARAVWKAAETGDVRARTGIEQLDLGLKTIYAAYKDLHGATASPPDSNRPPTTSGPFATIAPSASLIPARFRPESSPTPPLLRRSPILSSSIPWPAAESPSTSAKAWADAAGRRPSPRPRRHSRMGRPRTGFPTKPKTATSSFTIPLITPCSPIATKPAPPPPFLGRRLEFLHRIAEVAFEALRPGGFVALLLANQTEKDLPAGFGYLDHAFHGYKALFQAGFLPERRISCPMDGTYLPQHVRRAAPRGECSAKSATSSSCASRLATPQVLDSDRNRNFEIRRRESESLESSSVLVIPNRLESPPIARAGRALMKMQDATCKIPEIDVVHCGLGMNSWILNA